MSEEIDPFTVGYPPDMGTCQGQIGEVLYWAGPLTRGGIVKLVKVVNNMEWPSMMLAACIDEMVMEGEIVVSYPPGEEFRTLLEGRYLLRLCQLTPLGEERYRPVYESGLGLLLDESPEVRNIIAAKVEALIAENDAADIAASRARMRN